MDPDFVPIRITTQEKSSIRIRTTGFYTPKKWWKIWRHSPFKPDGTPTGRCMNNWGWNKGCTLPGDLDQEIGGREGGGGVVRGGGVVGGGEGGVVGGGGGGANCCNLEIFH